MLAFFAVFSFNLAAVCVIVLIKYITIAFKFLSRFCWYMQTVLLQTKPYLQNTSLENQP